MSRSGPARPQQQRGARRGFGRRLGPHDRVATVLTRAFAVVVGLAVLVGVVGAVAQALVVRSYDHLVDEIIPARRANLLTLQAMTDAETGVLGFLISGRPDFLDVYNGRQAVAKGHLAAAGGPDDDTLRGQVAAERAAVAEWFARYGEPAARGETVDSESGRRLFDEFRTTNRAVEERLVTLRAEAVSAADQLIFVGYLAMGVAVVVAAVVGTVVGRRATRQLVAPLARTQQAVDAMASGDLDARARVSGPAEIQAVSDSVTRLAEQLARLRDAERARQARDVAIREVVHAVQTGVDVEDVLRLAVSALGTATEVDRALFLPVSDGLIGAVQATWSAEGVRPFRAPPKDFRAPPVNVPGSQADIGATVAVDDVQAVASSLDPVVLRELERNGVQSFMAVPVVVGTDVRGLLSLNSLRGKRVWADGDRAVVEATARELGVALARAEVYSRQREMLDKLVEVDRERDVFVYTVSHELRTPLTSIVGYLEMVEDEDVGPLTDEQRDMIGKVARNAVRLQGLVADLLTLAKIQSGTFDVDLAPATLGPVVDGAWDAVAPAAAAGGLTLHRGRDADDVPLDLDPVQTDRMLTNLLSNAVKFTPPGGDVTLTTSREDGVVVVTVADTGIGIPAEEQSGLFTRFFRASTARQSAVPGTGLGLSLVAAIVHKHGGRISLTSEPGHGTTVRVRLPAQGWSG